MFNWGEEPYFIRKNLKNIIATSKKAVPKFGILNKFLIIKDPPLIPHWHERKFVCIWICFSTLKKSVTTVNLSSLYNALPSLSLFKLKLNSVSEAGLRLETAYREWCNSTKCYSNSKNVAIEGIKSQFPLWKILLTRTQRYHLLVTLKS